MPSILVYAELLLNIRHVTVFLILPSDPGPDTVASLSSDRRSIVITHQGEKQGLDLPCQVASFAASDLPLTKLKELSFRMQVATDLDLSQSQRQSSDIKGAPWAALSMTPESRIACRSCKNTLVKESIPVWKDLPSENWAEMMDFWHCHKPNTEDAHSIHTHELTKGYAASNQLAPSRGVALVDISHILLFENDCTGLQVCFSLTSIHAGKIFSLNCHSVVWYSWTSRRRPVSVLSSALWHGRRYKCPTLKSLCTISEIQANPSNFRRVSGLLSLVELSKLSGLHRG